LCLFVRVVGDTDALFTNGENYILNIHKIIPDSGLRRIFQGFFNSFGCQLRISLEYIIFCRTTRKKFKNKLDAKARTCNMWFSAKNTWIVSDMSKYDLSPEYVAIITPKVKR